MLFHDRSAFDVLRIFNVDKNVGLSQKAVAISSQKYGQNILSLRTKRTFFARLIDAVKEYFKNEVNEETKEKRGFNTEENRPLFAILNPELTYSVSKYQTACGITDIMAHLYERYLTNTKDVEVTDRMIEALLLTMVKEGPKAVQNQDDYGSRANIMWAGMMAHNNSCGVGRSQDWSSHNIEHELSAEYDCAHGAGLAVIMPACFTYNMEHDVQRFARVGKHYINH